MGDRKLSEEMWEDAICRNLLEDCSEDPGAFIHEWCGKVEDRVADLERQLAAAQQDALELRARRAAMQVVFDEHDPIHVADAIAPEWREP